MDIKLVIRGIAKKGETLYLVPGYLNGIISIDLSTDTTCFIRMSEKRSRVGQDLYEDVLVSDGRVWCSPCMEDDIAVYDLSEQKFIYLPLPKLHERGRNLFRCGGMYEAGENVIILPMEYPGVIRANKENFEITAISWKEELYQKYKEDFTEKMFALVKDYEIDSGETYLLTNNYILKYSNIDSSIRPVRVCSENKKFAGITRLEGKYILLDRSRAELFEWEPEENDLKKIDVDLGYGGMETENEEGDACSVGLVSTKDKVIIMLAASSYLYLMDAEYRIEKIALSVGDIAAYDLKWHYMCYEFDGRNLYLPVCYENRILVIDTETWEQKTVEIHLDNESEEIAFMDAMTAEKPVTENDLFYSLEHFISRLTNT